MFSWMSTFGGFAIAAIYLFISVGALRGLRDRGKAWALYLACLVGGVVTAAAIYGAIYKVTAPTVWAPYAAIAILVVGLIAAWFMPQAPSGVAGLLWPNGSRAGAAKKYRHGVTCVHPARSTREGRMAANSEIAIEGSLHASGGAGVVRMKTQFDTDIDDLWSALTERERLARWYGNFDGDFQIGGTFAAFIPSSGWDGHGRVEECDAPRHLYVTMWENVGDEQGLMVDLVDDAGHTNLMLEKRGIAQTFVGRTEPAGRRTWRTSRNILRVGRERTCPSGGT